MNQTQSYQPTTFFNPFQSESVTPSQQTSDDKIVVFETWDQFNQWMKTLSTNNSPFYDQLSQYQHLQLVEQQLNQWTSFLQQELALSLDKLLEVWTASQDLLTQIWGFTHQWVGTVSLSVQTFLTVWQTKNHLTQTSFHALGKLPVCCLSESDWEQFCSQQEALCLAIEPYLMCLDEEAVVCYERAIRWIKGYETLEDVNQQVMDGEWEVNRDFFSQGEGKFLNSVQTQAVLSNYRTTLVMGGAGSGKTTTMINKIKYLIQQKQISPQTLLVLGTTQQQLQSLKKKLGDVATGICFKTYHKLALELITTHQGNAPTLAEDSLLTQSVQEVLTNWFSKPETSQQLAYFFSNELGLRHTHYHGTTLKEFYELYEFKALQRLNISSWQDIESLANNLGEQHLTLKHEWVKSNEEVLLANFLFLNGIQYQYEAPYPHATSDSSYRQYYPDFYLPDYDLYLEHFGLNEKHKATWLNPEEAQKYEESVRWKRQLHQTYLTRLVETYSYEFRQKEWATHLRHKLETQGVRFQRIELYDVLKHLASQQRPLYHRFSTLVKSYIELFNKQGKTLTDLQHWLQLEGQKVEETSSHVFYQLVLEVMNHYDEQLKQLNQLNLNQLFAKAQELPPLATPYQYVLTDHMEDLTTTQFDFLLHFVKQHSIAWWMTADDNQAFHCLQDTCGLTFKQNYQRLMRQFPQTPVYNLEHNYRLTPNEESFFSHAFLTHVSPYPKKERALNQEKKIHTYTYHFNQSEALKAIIETLNQQIQPNEKIGIVGTHLETVINSLSLKIYKRFKKGIQLKHPNYPQLQLFYFHPNQVKGIEVDHLLVLEFTSLEKAYRRNKFPQAFESLLPSTDQQLKDELKNLYYLALTRATKNVYLIMASENRQSFLKEFVQHQRIETVWIEPYHLSFLNFIPLFNERLIEFPITNSRPIVPYQQIG